MQPKSSSKALVRDDPLIDGFVAHDRRAFAFRSTHDLLRTAVLTQPLFDRFELFAPIAPVAARSTKASPVQLSSGSIAVGAVVRRDVALGLSVDGRPVPAQSVGDLTRARSLLAQNRYSVSFLVRQVAVLHQSKVSHLPLESKEPNQSLQPTRTSGPLVGATSVRPRG